MNNKGFELLQLDRLGQLPPGSSSYSINWLSSPITSTTETPTASFSVYSVAFIFLIFYPLLLTGLPIFSLSLKSCTICFKRYTSEYVTLSVSLKSEAIKLSVLK